jgi:exonuclease III
LHEEGKEIILTGDVNVTGSDIDCTLDVEEWGADWLDPP